jgi:PE family protein
VSFVIAAPEMMTAAARDLATIGSNVSAAHMAAAAGTVAVLPAAADEVSASIAHLFSQHAANYHGLAAQAAAFNDQFVHHLRTGAQSYAGAEVAAAASLQHVTPAASAATGSLPGPLTLLRNFLSFPLQDQIIVLFVLGFIGVAAIYVTVMQWLVNFGLLPAP